MTARTQICVVLAALLAASALAVLPPGFEDVAHCPPTHCLRPIPGRSFAPGPRSVHVECFDPASGSTADEVWTGSRTDTVPPTGWVEAPECKLAATKKDASSARAEKAMAEKAAEMEKDLAAAAIQERLALDKQRYEERAAKESGNGAKKKKKPSGGVACAQKVKDVLATCRRLRDSTSASCKFAIKACSSAAKAAAPTTTDGDDAAAAGARAAVRAGLQELTQLRGLLARLARGDVKVRVGGCFPVGGQVWCLGAKGAWSRESDGCVYKAKEHGVYCPGADGEWHRVSAGASRDPHGAGNKGGAKNQHVTKGVVADAREDGGGDGDGEDEYEMGEEGGVLGAVCSVLFNLLLCLGLCACFRLAVRSCRRRARKRGDGGASYLPTTCQDGTPIIIRCDVVPDPAAVKEQEGAFVGAGYPVISLHGREHHLVAT